MIRIILNSLILFLKYINNKKYSKNFKEKNIE